MSSNSTSSPNFAYIITKAFEHFASDSYFTRSYSMLLPFLGALHFQNVQEFNFTTLDFNLHRVWCLYSLQVHVSLLFNLGDHTHYVHEYMPLHLEEHPIAACFQSTNVEPCAMPWYPP